MTLDVGLHVQMFRSSGQSDVKPQCSVPNVIELLILTPFSVITFYKAKTVVDFWSMDRLSRTHGQSVAGSNPAATEFSPCRSS
ncbi:hypothetical protein TNCV_91871 [Trichonephila clavipes]|nr:hypothetical protein TNCV_91871 [Trichonephila clavipes]